MAAPEELELKVKVTADPADISLADKVAQAVLRLREVLAAPASTTSVFAAERDALRDALNDELRFIKEAVAEKVATEEEGQKERLAIMEKYEAKFRALNAEFSRPVQGPQVGPGFFANRATETGAAAATPTAPPVQGLKAVSAAIIEASLANKEFTLSLEHGRELLASVDNDYARFQKDLLKIQEAYNQATVSAKGFTDQATRTPNPVQTTQPGVQATPKAAPLGPQLGPLLPPDWLANAKNATAAVNEASQATRGFTLTTELAREILKESGGDFDIFKQKVLALQKAHQAAAAAARGEAVEESNAAGKLQVFGNAADATFQRVPRGARTAANGLSILAISAETGATGVTSAVRAVGNLAFGLSTLSQNANIVAGAAGIGAVVTILATFIELMIRGTEKTREQEAAFKSFAQTEEAFAARAKITTELLDRLRNIKGADVSGVDFVGITKQVDDLHKALLQAEKDAREAFTHVSFSGAVSSDITGESGKVIALSQDLKKLRQEFLDGKITVNQFTLELEKLGKAQPDLLPQIIQTGRLAANYEAARESLRRFQAEAKQAAAERKSTTAFFGESADLAREADEANKRLFGIQKGGPIAALALENERQAMLKAQEAWKGYVASKRGSQFADIAFRDALEANDRARAATQLRLDEQLKTRKATQIEVTNEVVKAQQEAFSKLRTAFSTLQTDQEAQNTPGAIDALRKSNADLAKARAERLRGEVEAQKEAARVESELTIQRLRENTALEVKGGQIRNQLIANERERLRLQLIKIDEDAARSLAEAAARNSIDIAKKQAAAESAQLNVSKDEDERLLKAKLNSREITQTEFNARTLARELKFSDDLLKIQSRSLDAQEKALKEQLATPSLKPAEQTRIKGQLEDVDQERRKAIADADDRAAKANGAALESTGTISKKVVDETAQAQIQILRLTGHNADAAALEIKQKFKDLIAELKQIGGPGSEAAVDIVVELKGLAKAKSEMEGLQDDVSSQLDQMAAKLNQVHVLLGAHAITERDARRQIVEAEIKARDVIIASLPALEKQAQILGDRKSAQQVLELKTRLIELNEEIRRNSDDFIRLKDVIRDSTQNAFEEILIKAPTIAFSGGGNQGELNTLRDHVKSARDELEKLLELPVSDRTDVVNNRITELRREIDETTNSLNNAKSAIDGWKNLFLRAIDSILDAMLKLEAQMIAQIALEKISQLGKIIFGAIGAASGAGGTGFVDDAGGGGTVFAASGGAIFGPGTGTSDSIPARLSNREFVEPEISTSYYGFGIFELLRRRLIPRELIQYISKGLAPLHPRMVTAHQPFAADGGLVSVGPQLHSTEAQPSARAHLLVEASKDSTVRLLKSDEGMQITFGHIQNNVESIRALLGI